MKPEPLIDLRPPQAPPALRQRVLLAARRAALNEAKTTRLDRWVDRLWGSRPLRLAFWTATMVLVLAHLGLQLENRHGRLTAPGRTVASNELAEALGIEVQDLPSERGATLASYHPTEKIEELGL